MEFGGSPVTKRRKIRIAILIQRMVLDQRIEPANPRRGMLLGFVCSVEAAALYPAAALRTRCSI